VAVPLGGLQPAGVLFTVTVVKAEDGSAIFTLVVLVQPIAQVIVAE